MFQNSGNSMWIKNIPNGICVGSTHTISVFARRFGKSKFPMTISFTHGTKLKLSVILTTPDFLWADLVRAMYTIFLLHTLKTSKFMGPFSFAITAV